MADVYKGLTIQFGAETTGLDKALKDISKRSSSIGRELQSVNRLLKLDPKNTTLLAQKQQLLADKVVTTKQRLDALKQAQAQVEAMYKAGEIDAGQYRHFQRQLINAETELKNVESTGKKTGRSLGQAMKDAGDKVKSGVLTIAKAGAALGATVLASLGALGVAAMNNADELQRQSDVTGLSAERLQELAYIGQDVGVELDTLTGAQAKLIKSMYAAKDGTGKQADAFKQLGIDVKDSHGNLRDANDVMAEAFDKLANVKNETERTALAQQIFGKSAAELNPMLKLGGQGMKDLADQARDTGAVMSDEAVAGLDMLGDTLDHLKTSVLAQVGEKFAYVARFIEVFMGRVQAGQAPLQVLHDMLQSSFGIDLTPVLSVIIAIGNAWNWIREKAAALGAFLQPFFTWVVQTIQGSLGPTIENMRQWFQATLPVLKVIGTVLGVIIVAAIVIVVGAIALLLVALAKIVQGVTWVYKTITTKFVEAKNTAVGAFNAIRDGITRAINAARDAVGRAIDKVKGFFNFKWKLPHIDLPHFKITGSFSLKPPSVPSLSVDWYASGGSFAAGAPALIGVGDQRSGFEHVLRDDQIVSLMARALKTFAGGGLGGPQYSFAGAHFNVSVPDGRVSTFKRELAAELGAPVLGV